MRNPGDTVEGDEMNKNGDTYLFEVEVSYEPTERDKTGCDGLYVQSIIKSKMTISELAELRILADTNQAKIDENEIIAELRESEPKKIKRLKVLIEELKQCNDKLRNHETLPL